MKFRRSRRKSARAKTQRGSDSQPAHLISKPPPEELPVEIPVDDKVHTGFESYRRQSRQLLDMHTQTGQTSDTDGPYSAKAKKSTSQKPQGNLKKSAFRSKSSKNRLDYFSARDSRSRQAQDRIKFNPQEEVKEFVVQQRSYKQSGNKDPFGLEILLHADQLWLEHASSSTIAGGVSGSGSLPLYEYQFSVYDDSEQRILFIRPESFNQFVNIRPKNYVIFSAIGTDLCRLHVAPPFCCSSKQIVVDIIRQERKIGSVSLMGNCFKAYDRRGDKILTINAVNSKKKNRFRFCPRADENRCPSSIVDPNVEFLCDIFTAEGEREHVGTIRQNGSDPQKRVRGEPGGFYCMLNERQGSKTKAADEDSIVAGQNTRTSTAEGSNKNMLKLNIIVALLVLMVYFKPPSSGRTSTETDRKTTPSTAESEPTLLKPVGTT